MARPLRVELVNCWYHITSRGNEKRAIFRDQKDREQFLSYLSEFENRFGIEVHSYVLMSNHYHLLVRLKREELTRAMHWFGVSYTVWFNRRHQRVGHLFQGRYKAIIVDFEEWGISLSRYIHLNPVRRAKYGLDKHEQIARAAGLGAKRTDEQIREGLEELHTYPWSSYKAFVGKEKAPPWLHSNEILSAFGDGRKAQRAYQQYTEECIRDGTLETPMAEVIAGFVLGGEKLLKKVRDLAKGNREEQPTIKMLFDGRNLEEIVKAVSQQKQQQWEDYRDVKGDWGRDMVLYLAKRLTSLKNRELGEFGGMCDSAVSHAVRRFEKRLIREPRLKKVAEELYGDLSTFNGLLPKQSCI